MDKLVTTDRPLTELFRLSEEREEGSQKKDAQVKVGVVCRRAVVHTFFRCCLFTQLSDVVLYFATIAWSKGTKQRLVGRRVEWYVEETT